MPRPKVFTEVQLKQRRRDSSLKWMREHKNYVNAKSIEWAKNNPAKIKINAKKHRDKVKYDYRFRINRLWYLMIKRCYDKNNKRYLHYGGRGIFVCDEWRYNRGLFIEWALINGYTIGLTIERVDNNGNYEPGNCIFASQKVQSNNKRTNVFIEHNGMKKTLAQWSEFYNIPKATLWWRYKQDHTKDKIFNCNHIQSGNRLLKKY